MWISSGFDLLDARHAHCRPFPREFAPGQYRDDRKRVCPPPPDFFRRTAPRHRIVSGTDCFSIVRSCLRFFADSAPAESPRADGPGLYRSGPRDQCGGPVRRPAEDACRAACPYTIPQRTSPWGKSGIRTIEHERRDTEAADCSAICFRGAVHPKGGGVKIFCPLAPAWRTENLLGNRRWCG